MERIATARAEGIFDNDITVIFSKLRACSTLRISLGKVQTNCAPRGKAVSVCRPKRVFTNNADQAGNSSAPHPALSPSDGERVAEGRVRGKPLKNRELLAKSYRLSPRSPAASPKSPTSVQSADAPGE